MVFNLQVVEDYVNSWNERNRAEHFWLFRNRVLRMGALQVI